MLTIFAPLLPEVRVRPLPPPRAKTDWPLMCDVATCRAGVPEALIQWRKAKGEKPPEPML